MVVAKGTEDTTFYRYTRFAALNEVGGSPDRWGIDVDELHRLAAARDANTPASMTTLTTHDTKRSEDTRARMLVLAEVADDFATAVRDWSARCGLDEPSLNLLAWQTLVSAWPISDERLVDYLLKAAASPSCGRRGPSRTRRSRPRSAAWPARVGTSSAPRSRPSWTGSRRQAGRTRWAQKIIQLTAPGVPDVYQGTELWDFSLVDPDNRRPVDYDLRRDLLEQFERGSGCPRSTRPAPPRCSSSSAPSCCDGTARSCSAATRRSAAEGPSADHAIAYARSKDLVVVATRLPVGLGSGRRLAGHACSGSAAEMDRRPHGKPRRRRRGSVSAVLDRYPVALLVRD